MGERNIAIGKLGKPHGIGGAFRFMFYRALKSKKKLPAYLMLEQRGNVAPFFLKSVELKGWTDGFLRFEEITNPEEARLYSGHEFYLPEKEVTALFEAEADELAYLVGFKVFDANKEELGLIKEVTEGAAQILIVMTDLKGSDHDIPLADDFIIKLDKRNKALYLQLPEGLLDL